jgi:hypothetical protein
MRKIHRLDYRSVVSVFAVFYAIIGVFAATKAAIASEDSVVFPFGFEYPLSHLNLDITFNLPHPASWITPVVVFIAAIFYAMSGVISGVTLVFFYNLTSKFWPGISAQVQDEERLVEPNPGIGLV